MNSCRSTSFLGWLSWPEGAGSLAAAARFFETNGVRAAVLGDSVTGEAREVGRGHVLRVLGPYGMNSGVVAVGVNPRSGTLRGGADLRRERYIMGW